MTAIIDESGNIELVQGDSLTLYVDGIPTNKNYKAYFSIYDKYGNIIGNEVWVQTQKQSTIILEVPSSLTDNLVVENGIDSTAEYYYGIKICIDETATGGIKYEETLCVGDSDIGDLNTMTVYPKKVEGIV